jgi:guanylate kinase
VGAGPLLVVLTGPSGAGKDTLLAHLKSLGRHYHISVNATTRDQRPGEVHGVDYYFVSQEEFQRMLDDGDLLEHAIVYGQDKGVPKAPIRKALAEGRDVLMRTDIQGARTIQRLIPGAITIFVSPPSDDELRSRVKKRGGDSDEQVKLRQETAVREMAVAGEFDYTVVNDDLARTADEIDEIISSERARAGREAVRL